MKRLVVIAGLILGLGAPGWAVGVEVVEDGVSPADEVAIHAVVQTQLDAFAEDDAVAAFELATVDTQTKVGSAENFLRMVKKHYNPIYRHQIVIFSRPEVIAGETIQLVRLTDRDSHVWLAIYHMQREMDGTWKIDNCHLLETTSISI